MIALVFKSRDPLVAWKGLPQVTSREVAVGATARA